jgi:MOSC domain-containing protein YiiM
MFRGKILSIHITPAEGQAMQSVESVEAVAGGGLQGDRYFLGTGTYSDKPDPARQVTLIENEAIQAVQHEASILLEPGDSRRNLVTQGVPLNHLVGKEFYVGKVQLRGIRLCEPCKHLAGMTQPGVLPALVHRGGLRAEILTSGKIQIGDIIGAVADQPDHEGN